MQIHAAVAWILAVVAVEAATEIVVSSSLFFRFRNFLAGFPGWFGAFFGELISCGYCFSVWMSATIAWTLPGDVLNGEYAIIPNIIIRTLVLHRVSNIIHGLITRICDRPAKEHVISLFTKEAKDGGNEAGSQEDKGKVPSGHPDSH